MSSHLSVVSKIANIAPWLAPIPSAFFVARSSIQHLNIPLFIGVIIGIIIETLGFSTVHLYLELNQWNVTKRKTDPKAPEFLALGLVVVYIIIAISMTVVLEIYPKFSMIAPALFPVLALTGTFTLTLFTEHEQRLSLVQLSKQERCKKPRNLTNNNNENVSNLGNNNELLNIANMVRKQNKKSILEHLEAIMLEHPEVGVTELKRLIGVRSRSTVYSYIKELQQKGRIAKTQPFNS